MSGINIANQWKKFTIRLKLELVNISDFNILVSSHSLGEMFHECTFIRISKMLVPNYTNDQLSFLLLHVLHTINMTI